MSTQHKLDEAFERIKLLEAEVETVIEEMDALNEKMKAQEVYWKTYSHLMRRCSPND